MQRPLITVLAIALLSSATAAQAAAQADLKKAGSWEVDYDADSCHLTGKFGSDPQSVIARFTQYEPSSTFELALYGKPIYSSDVKIAAMVDFGLGQAAGKANGLAGTTGKLPLVIFGGMRLDRAKDRDAPAVTPQQEASVSQLTFRLPGSKTYRLMMGAMGRPMAALRTCLVDLEKHWGYDPIILDRLSRLPVPLTPPQKWLNSSDYPSKALAGGHNGLIHFRLDLDETGTITKCSIIGKTTPDDFETATCDGISRRARFDPALDASGKPVKAFWINTVLWQMGS